MKIRPKREASFVALYIKNFKPWDNHSPMNAFVVIRRYTMEIGFVGGLVDPGETPLETVIREVNEEINYEMNHNNLIHICSHYFEEDDFATHLFAKEITFDDYKEIISNSVQSEHFGKEIFGIDLILDTDLNEIKTIETFLKSPLAKSVKEEIEELRKFLN